MASQLVLSQGDSTAAHTENEFSRHVQVDVSSRLRKKERSLLNYAPAVNVEQYHIIVRCNYQ